MHSLDGWTHSLKCAIADGIAWMHESGKPIPWHPNRDGLADQKSTIVGFDVTQNGHVIGRFVGYLHLFENHTVEELEQALRERTCGSSDAA